MVLFFLFVHQACRWLAVGGARMGMGLGRWVSLAEMVVALSGRTAVCGRDAAGVW